MSGENQLENNQILEFWNWFKRVGPLTDRSSLPSVWSSIDNSGYDLHEALNLFEKIDFELKLGVYAGHSLNQTFVFPSDLAPYMQLAVHQLHYIKGAQGSSDLSRRREKNGRAQPRKLNFVEIGNGDWLTEAAVKTYCYRFWAFHKALTPAFPNVLFLVSSPYSTQVEACRRRPAGLQHSEARILSIRGTRLSVAKWNPDHKLECDIINNGRCGVADSTDLYHDACRLEIPTLESALSEDTWTVGFERNSDLVTTTLYGPLFLGLCFTILGPLLLNGTQI